MRIRLNQQIRSYNDYANFRVYTWCFPFALIYHWISIVFLLYGRRIATHSVDPSLTHFLGELPGLGLVLVPDVLVPEAEQRCPWSRKLDPNFWCGGGRTSGPWHLAAADVATTLPCTPTFSRLLRHAGGYSRTILTPQPAGVNMHLGTINRTYNMHLGTIKRQP